MSSSSEYHSVIHRCFDRLNCDPLNGVSNSSYFGAGDAINTNTFNFSTLTPITNDGSQTPFNLPGFWQQSLFLSANDFINFTLDSVSPTGGGCTISAGGSPDGVCSYLIAYDTLDPNAVFIGFSDQEAFNGACPSPESNVCPDYQDLVVRVSLVPEPLTLSLFGVGLVGAAALRRRRKNSVA